MKGWTAEVRTLSPSHVAHCTVQTVTIHTVALYLHSQNLPAMHNEYLVKKKRQATSRDTVTFHPCSELIMTLEMKVVIVPLPGSVD